MPSSFQQWMKRMQHFLFNDEEQPEANNRESRIKRSGEDPPPYIARMTYQESEPVKMFNVYPKSYEEAQKQKSSAQAPDRPSAAKLSGSSAEPSTAGHDRWETEQERSGKSSKRSESRGEKKTEIEESSYFRGKNFEAGSIPSPIFGYQQADLHPGNLRDPETEERKETSVQEQIREDIAFLNSIRTGDRRPSSVTKQVEEKEAGRKRRAPSILQEDTDRFMEISRAQRSGKWDTEAKDQEAENSTPEDEPESEEQKDPDLFPSGTAFEIEPEEAADKEPVEAEGPEQQQAPQTAPVPRQEERTPAAIVEGVQEIKPEAVENKPVPVPEKSELPASTNESKTEEPKTEEPKTSSPSSVKEKPAVPAKKQTGSKRTSTSTPFNVMMYPKDKRSVQQQSKQKGYQLPSLQLLNIPPKKEDEDESELEEQREQLETTLKNFHVDAKVSQITKGPSVTRFEVQPAPGVKVTKVTNLTDDIKMALAAKDLRMEAPIPGKNAIGIEVPNPTSAPVFLREILRRDVFKNHQSPLSVAMGLDIGGNPVIADLQNMPHGLIAGATGSGKSVCINSILLSLLYKSSPEECKWMLIDPKMVELASYREVPHLITPVINDAKEATGALKWAVQEMEDRYERLAREGVRDMKKYNERMEKQGRPADKMPYLVIVIDELADLMMVSPQDVEDAICRIAQKARACGMHLLVATQRPSVDVITGLIKANIPTRIAFSVSSQVDSRTILDGGGAERLIGKGDMLFYPNGASKPTRVQGTFVTDEEIDAVTDFVKEQKKPVYQFQKEELQKHLEKEEHQDPLYDNACEFVIDQKQASASQLQRRFSLGYNRAAKLIDTMENRGIVSEARGSKPRNVLVTRQEWEESV
ncbi:DNA translocase FtsK [Marinococcus luteus]|uniref:DNA translocase FtsK n=1 Tax=Marinococcus luteus TaxID=1122204 RepID=A0A1H2Y9X3_9BACI|nr:DNA translocase FtsK [Marinococcus luteus]SDX01464.1 DNA translocase FtsK [Marinococcus luteus]